MLERPRNQAHSPKRKNLDELQKLRKRNLLALVRTWEGPTKLAKKLNYSGPSYLSQLVGPNKPITEKTARQIEAALNLPDRWMDADYTLPDPPRTDTALIQEVMLSVGTALGDTVLPPPRLAGFVSLVYEHATEHGGHVDEEFTHTLAKLITDD